MGQPVPGGEQQRLEDKSILSGAFAAVRVLHGSETGDTQAEAWGQT